MTIIDIIHERVFRNLLKYLSRQAIIIFTILVLVYVIAQQREAIASLQLRYAELAAQLSIVKGEQDQREGAMRVLQERFKKEAANFR